jgi:hypothetical protein
VSRITFCLSCLCRFTTHLLDPGWGLDLPPVGARVPAVDIFYVDGGCSWISSSGTSPMAYCQYFLALIVGTPGSPSLAPPRGLVADIFMLIFGAPGSLSAPLRWAHHRCFLALMVGTTESPALAPPRRARHRHFLLWWWVLSDLRQHLSGGPPSMFLSIDGGRSRISSSSTS